jgi:phosphoribosylformimino-5-aminoimidazole carboxamide ribotide isomerase
VIIPCIDLQDGRAVQLVRGKRLALSVDDVMGLLARFERFPILHVIDLDAAMRKGSNGGWVQRLCERGKMRVRVGGGIRTAARAKRVLSWGADKIIVGSAAFKDGAVNHAFLRELRRGVGRKRLMVALDTRRGKVVVRGWKESLGVRAQDVIRELEPYCSEFMATFVDNEGTMRGTDLAWYRELRRATKLPITAAGGIRTLREVRVLEKLGMNAAVGMAIYRGKLLEELEIAKATKTRS